MARRSSFRKALRVRRLTVVKLNVEGAPACVLLPFQVVLPQYKESETCLGESECPCELCKLREPGRHSRILMASCVLSLPVTTITTTCKAQDLHASHCQTLPTALKPRGRKLLIRV